MKKELFGQIDFTHNNTDYYIEYEVSYVSDENYGYIEDHLYYVVSDTDGTKVNNNDVLLKAEKLVEKELDFLDIE